MIALLRGRGCMRPAAAEWAGLRQGLTNGGYYCEERAWSSPISGDRSYPACRERDDIVGEMILPELGHPEFK